MNNLNPIQMLFHSNGMRPQRPSQPIDPVRFKQGISKINEETLKQIVIQARNQGILEDAIEQGLNFLLSLK